MDKNEMKVNSLICLKLLNLKHAQTIYNAIDNNRNHLRKWLPFIDYTKSVDDTIDYITSVVADDHQRIFTIWYDYEFAGLIGLKDIDYHNCKVEIGYWLTESMTGKGIITQSTEELIHFIYDELQLNRIQIKCGVGNFASSAVPKRLNFKSEGIERQGEKHTLHYIDLEIYSLLKEEWG